MYLWQPQWGAGEGAWCLVARLLLGLQQVVLEGLNQEVLTPAAGLDQGLLLHPLYQVLLGDQRQSHVLQELGDLLLSTGQVVLDPGQDSFVHL